MIEFLGKFVSKAMSWLTIAERIIDLLNFVIPDIVGFIMDRVEEYKKRIDAITDPEQKEEMKEVAAKSVVMETQAEFSASPSWVPKQVVVAIMELVVYMKKFETAPDMRGEKAVDQGTVVVKDNKSFADFLQNMRQ